MLKELQALYSRDLNKLMDELHAYPDEASLWRVQGDIANPAGNLALHLIGNLSKFIGDDLGGVPFQRDRDAEFSRCDVPRQELLDGLERTRQVVTATLEKLDAARLDAPFPNLPPTFQPGMTTAAFLLHLYGHLNWHLGQVYYHRRLTTPL